MFNDDSASTHSSVSTATTLKGTELHNKKKWFSSNSKSKTSEPKFVQNSDGRHAKQALHNEAIATYLSLR